MNRQGAIVGVIGAVVGGLLGLLGGPLGVVVGLVLGAIVGLGAGAVVSRRGAPVTPGRLGRIDPFTIAEPWRRLAQDALRARSQFQDAVRRTAEGPIRDRLGTIGERIDDTVQDAWETARAGDELAAAYARLDVRVKRRELDSLDEHDARVAPLQAQLDTAERMATMITDTRDRLRLLNTRLDESVARSIELSVGAFAPDEFSQVEGAVGSISDELEALRSALEITSSPTGIPRAQGGQ